MGKYALLLQQLMKSVTSIQGPSLQEISEDIEELQKAEEMVRFQLRHGNDLLAMDSLRDCDVSTVSPDPSPSTRLNYSIIIFDLSPAGKCERTGPSVAPKRIPRVAGTWWQKITAPSISL